jgi:hypothetical protein
MVQFSRARSSPSQPFSRRAFDLSAYRIIGCHDSADGVNQQASPDVGCWQIVLKKSFLGDEQNFLGPLMRLASGDVRDHIVSHKNDHGPPYRRYGALLR